MFLALSLFCIFLLCFRDLLCFREAYMHVFCYSTLPLILPSPSLDAIAARRCGQAARAAGARAARAWGRGGPDQGRPGPAG